MTWSVVFSAYHLVYLASWLYYDECDMSTPHIIRRVERGFEMVRNQDMSFAIALLLPPLAVQPRWCGWQIIVGYITIEIYYYCVNRLFHSSVLKYILLHLGQVVIWMYIAPHLWMVALMAFNEIYVERYPTERVGNYGQGLFLVDRTLRWAKKSF